MDEFTTENIGTTQKLPDVPKAETRSVDWNRPVRQRPTRRRKTKAELFKENTLPVLILGVTAILILVFIVGSIVRAVQQNNADKAASLAASQSVEEESARLAEEAKDVLEKADALAASFDYDGAMAMIDTFSGNVGGYPELENARVSYQYSKDMLIPWQDPNAIVNLSFQTLIADPARAFNHPKQGGALEPHYVTVSEFQKILERLYANNYILVSPKDYVQTTTNTSGETVFQYLEMNLPEGKKPLVLTQTNVNYNLYLVDSDDDMIADKGGAGIASKLLLQDDGSITCEMVDGEGKIVTGAYDLVPVLDAFVEAHPDFSYKGAKAVLALTGYNGLFGYRTQPAAREKLGEAAYNKEIESAKAMAQRLQETGYVLANYTYECSPYGSYSLSNIQMDIGKWNDEVVPILGKLDTLVLAQNSDISAGTLYSGEKYDYLKSQGYDYYIGFCVEGSPYTYIAEEYIHQGRVMVTGYNIRNNPKWFIDIFDTNDLLDPAR